MDSKRTRTANFTPQELEILIDQIEMQKQILLNKKNDAVLWQDKKEAWKKVTNALNTKFLTTRIWRQVRAKFDKLKSESKKVMTDILTKTKEGSPDAYIDPILARVYNLVKSQCKEFGLTSYVEIDDLAIKDHEVEECYEEYLDVNQSVMINTNVNAQSPKNYSDTSSEVQTEQIRIMREEFTAKQHRENELHELIKQEFAEKKAREDELHAHRLRLMREEFAEKLRRESELHQIVKEKMARKNVLDDEPQEKRMKIEID